jgi:hypothetical protein
MARPAADLEYPCAVGGDRRDVVSDLPDERAEDEPTHGVVDGGVANEDPSWHLSPPGAAAVPNDGDGCAGCSEQDDEPSRSTHHSSFCICGWFLSVGCGLEILVPLAAIRLPDQQPVSSFLPVVSRSAP